MRLIDADALINEIKKETKKAIEQDDKVGSFWLGYIAGLVIKQPTIQPEPKEGHWINGKCDLCGEHAPFWCMASTYHESNYCPHCGAKMTISTK